MENHKLALYSASASARDPDLITIKAAKILGRVDIVFAAASTKNQHSIAMGIARPHIPSATPVELLKFHDPG